MKRGLIVGSKVKIEDVGPIGICVRKGRYQIEVELEGVTFWIPKRLCKVV